MELRSGRRLRSSQQLCSPGGGRPDRISALSDDMLLLIVGRIGCAVDAVRTTVLSRRWRDIFALHWAIVSEIVFRDVAFSSLEAALGRVCLCHPSTAVYYLQTRVHGTCIPDERTHNSLLRAASRLQAREFSASLSSHAGTGLCEGSTFVGGCFHNQLPGSVRATCHVYLRPGLIHGGQNCPST